MNGIRRLAATLVLPRIAQIGIVVHDVDKTATQWASKYGSGPFKVYEFDAEKAWYHEQPSIYRMKTGKAMVGNVEIELMEPIEGPSPMKEFLQTRGEGLQHLGFLVQDYDAYFARFLAAGFKPALRVQSYLPAYGGIVKACCFDTLEVGGVMIEIAWKSWLVSK